MLRTYDSEHSKLWPHGSHESNALKTLFCATPASSIVIHGASWTCALDEPSSTVFGALVSEPTASDMTSGASWKRRGGSAPVKIQRPVLSCRTISQPPDNCRDHDETYDDGNHYMRRLEQRQLHRSERNRRAICIRAPSMSDFTRSKRADPPDRRPLALWDAPQRISRICSACLAGCVARSIRHS